MRFAWNWRSSIWPRSVEYSLRYPTLKLSVSYLSTSKSHHFADFVTDLQARITISLMLIPQCDWSMRNSNSNISCTIPLTRTCFFTFFWCCFLEWLFLFSRFVLIVSFILVVLPTFFSIFLSFLPFCYFIFRLRAFFFIFLPWFCFVCISCHLSSLIHF